MKAEIEAKIANLEAELAAEKAKLEQFVNTIPQEWHDLPKDIFDKIKAFFA